MDIKVIGAMGDSITVSLFVILTTSLVKGLLERPCLVRDQVELNRILLSKITGFLKL